MTNLKTRFICISRFSSCYYWIYWSFNVSGAAKVSYVSKDETKLLETFSMKILLSLDLEKWIME